MSEEMLSISEAAKIAGCNSSTLRRAAINGDLPAKKVGSYWAVALADVRNWMNNVNLHKVGRKPKTGG